MDSRASRRARRRTLCPSTPAEGPRRSSRGVSRPAPWAGVMVQGLGELLGGVVTRPLTSPQLEAPGPLAWLPGTGFGIRQQLGKIRL